jgi:hypothetical protein
MKFSFVRLPGDGLDQAEADDEAKSGREEDGPGVCGEPEGGTSAWGGHNGVSLEENAVHTKESVAADAMKFSEKE